MTAYRLKSDKKRPKPKKRFPLISWLIFLLGIFLLPQLALLSAITPENMIKLSNEEREKQGLPALSANQLLTQAAYNKAEAIFDSQRFSHQIDERGFSSWIKDTGYKYSYVGENLAVDFITAEGAIRAWLESEDHRKNLLNPQFAEIGLAVVEGELDGQKTVLIVQVFGAPPIPLKAGIPDQAGASPLPLDFAPADSEAFQYAHSSAGLGSEFFLGFFEDSLIRAKYLPGFLGQGQKRLLELLSFSGLAALSAYSVSFVVSSLTLALLAYFIALVKTEERKRRPKGYS